MLTYKSGSAAGDATALFVDPTCAAAAGKGIVTYSSKADSTWFFARLPEHIHTQT